MFCYGNVNNFLLELIVVVYVSVDEDFFMDDLFFVDVIEFGFFEVRMGVVLYFIVVG